VALLSLATALAVGILSRSRPGLFVPYFGGFDPLPVVLLVVAVEAVCLRLLRAGGFEIVATPFDRRGVTTAAALAVVFAVPAISADLIIRFPRDMNVAPVPGLVFYPAIAYVVEIVFHVLPLALTLAVLRRLATIGDEHLAWVCVLMTSLLEPTFQLLLGTEPRAWMAGAFVWVHVFAFNVAQLQVFRRHDFVSMYALRVVYYLCWHIAWGALRLHLLFP
jgi:hypothetical protein